MLWVWAGPLHLGPTPPLQERSLLLLLDFSGQANKVTPRGQSKDVEEGTADPGALGEDHCYVN